MESPRRSEELSARPKPRREGKMGRLQKIAKSERMRRGRGRTNDRSDLYKATQLGLALAADSEPFGLCALIFGSSHRLRIYLRILLVSRDRYAHRSRKRARALSKSRNRDPSTMGRTAASGRGNGRGNFEEVVPTKGRDKAPFQRRRRESPIKPPISSGSPDRRVYFSNWRSRSLPQKRYRKRPSRRISRKWISP